MYVFDISLCLFVFVKVSREWSRVRGFSKESVRKETVEQAQPCCTWQLQWCQQEKKSSVVTRMVRRKWAKCSSCWFPSHKIFILSADRGSHGEDHGGAQPLLPAGAWKRHDPEGAAEGRETEETRGEKNTVRIFNVTFVMFMFIPFIPHLFLFLRHRKLKNELLEIKRKGSRRPQDPRERQCARCLKTLGLIFDRGDLCEECRLRVCSECRVTAAGSRQWRCNVCAKIS